MKNRGNLDPLIIDLRGISPYLMLEPYARACTAAYGQYLQLKKGRMLWDVLCLLKEQYKNDSTESLVCMLLLSRELGKVFAHNDHSFVPQFEDELKWLHNIMLKDSLYYFYIHRLSLTSLLIERGYRRSELENKILSPGKTCGCVCRIVFPSDGKKIIINKEDFRQRMKVKALEMMLPESCRSMLKILEETALVQEAMIRYHEEKVKKDIPSLVR